MENGLEYIADVQVSINIYIYVCIFFYLLIFIELSCNKPKLSFGATIRGRSYLYQDQLTYVCPGGKKLGLITCQADGYWSDPPNCNDN